MRYGQIDRGYGIRLATTPTDEDGPVWMINLMSYRAMADYTDGRESSISGREADDRYTPLGPLAAVGAEIVFAADVEEQLLGDEPKWDRVAVVKYPTRRAFIEMQQREDFREFHHHKEAGMSQTIVMGSQPIADPSGEIELPEWSSVPHPPTDDDGDVMVIHVLKFEEESIDATTPEDMAEYQQRAGRVAIPHGVRVAGWFGVEGTILGDGRSWDQVRFNAFPSRRAFMAVVFDPDRLAAQHDHRETAIADTYTLITRPTINRLADSVS